MNFRQSFLTMELSLLPLTLALALTLTLVDSSVLNPPNFNLAEGKISFNVSD